MKTILDRAEWDFPQELSGQQLTACWIYEYARESEVLRAAASEIKELRKKEWRDYKKIPPEPRLTLRGTLLPEGRQVSELDISKFITIRKTPTSQQATALSAVLGQPVSCLFPDLDGAEAGS